MAEPDLDPSLKGRTTRVVAAMGKLKPLLRASIQGVTLLALAMIALIWFAVEFNMSGEREQALHGAERNIENLARVFEEHVIRTIAEVDKTILFVRNAYEKDPSGFDLQSWVQSQYYLEDLTVQISISGPTGDMISTNLGRLTTPVNIRDREHFQVHANAREDYLFISKPLIGRASGKWSVQLTRRIRAKDGSFGGVIVASLDPYRLSRFYEQIDIGKEGVIYLIGRDGIMRAGAGSTVKTIGSSFEDSELLRGAFAANAGVYASHGRWDGVPRIFAFRAVQGLPLILTVGMSRAEIFAAVGNHSLVYRGVAAGMTLVLLFVVVIGTRHRLRLAEADRALMESKTRIRDKSRELEVTLDNMSQGIMMIDQDNKVAVMNRQATALLGLPERFLGARVDFQDILRFQWATGEFGPDGQAVPPEVRTYLLAGGVGDTLLAYERQRPNGTVVEIRSVPLPNGGVVRTYSDITERKRAEIALAEARDKAEAASRARSSFLATMSHEIRTPLNGIVGMASLLASTPLTEEQQRYIATLSDCSDTLLDVINDVLDFTKLDSGALEVERCEAVLRDIITASMEIVRPRLAKKALSYELDFDEALPGLIISDAARIRQVLLNLLSNAAKFTEEGFIRVKARDISPAAAEQRWLQITVEDSGIGIAEEARERLFREFSQVDASITRRFGGTGLGLAICKRIVTALGGRIGFDSTPGKGSRFWFELPFDAAKADASKPTAAAPAPESAAPAPEGASHGLSILVAEDNRVNQQVAVGLLKKLGHAVEVVEDGAGALAACSETDFDLVFMDMQMPVMDGIAATRAIRVLPGSRGRVTIVGLTASAFDSDRAACLEAGMNGFVSKPINRDKLERAIAEARRGISAPPAGERDAGPIIDRSQRDSLEQHLGAEVLRGLVHAFWEDASAILQGLRAALARDDLADVRRALHTLQGTAGTLGYNAIVASLANCRAGARKDQAAFKLALAELIEAMDVAVAAERASGFDVGSPNYRDAA